MQGLSKETFKGFDFIKITLILSIVGLLIWFFFDIVTYIIVSIILTAILRTPTNYISQMQFYGVRAPRIIAISISFAILFGLIVLFIYQFVPLVSAQIQVISSVNFESLLNTVMIPVDALESFLLENKLFEEEPGFLKENTKKVIQDFFSDSRETGVKNNNFLDSLLSFTGGILSLTGNVFIGLLAVLFITFFFLYEKGSLRKYFISLIPNKYFEVSIAAVSKTEKLLSNYLLGLFLQMISIFSIVAFGLLIVGVDYAITIAVFAAIANLIPFLGPILGAIFGLFIGLSTNAGLAESQDYFILTAKIVTVFGIVQLTDNIFLQPIIFSKSVKAHPLEIFLIVFVGANLAGPLGMISAIPSYTIIKVAFGEFYKGYKQYQVFRNK